MTAAGLIDLAASDKRLESFGAKPKPAKRRKGRAQGETMREQAKAQLAGIIDGGELLSKAEAERVKENYLALLRRLEYEQKSGRLVEAEPLRRKLFDLWRTERDAWLNWPTRIGAILSTELGVDQNTLTIALEKHVNEHLLERAENPRIDLGPDHPPET